MATILFVWTVVAAARSDNHMDWRALAECSSPATCQRAIAELGLKPGTARCVAK
jgi:hypothetical protein